ncbi:tetratricopeptide repeat protein [Phytohabitans houttuyneae]|uniref:Peptidase C14 caspase domain-containing protein n=1 Tax=Phytohabitans houttuyneae TaxID=1076126 RepID=A0A6V8KAK5_9ACTN|nr:tetratricopeptide repeat protein [Phytohabitans houttuyneae]GFJ82262.1 hypothetical protein Phou_064420 [Phytohabitans houttuyneae]
MDGRYIGIGVARYQHHPPLPRAAADVAALAGAFGGHGFATATVSDPESADLVPRLRTAFAGIPPVAVVHWAGHGVAAGPDELALLLSDSGQPVIRDETYDPATLVDRALRTGARQVLLILDCCYAGTASLTALRLAKRFEDTQVAAEGEDRWVGVLASARSYEEAVGGRLAETLARLVRYGPTSREYQIHWSAHNEGVCGIDIMRALVDEWPHDGQKPVGSALDVRSLPMIPNPRYDPHAPDRLVAHLVLSARGAAPDEEGWFFTGRLRVLGAITAWLAGPGPGMFVVTGPAGSGKSAVVGRVAALSDPRTRADMLAHGALAAHDPDPGQGTVDVALYARGQRYTALLGELARGLDIAAGSDPVSIDDVLRVLESRGGHPTVLLDALDEAYAPDLHRIATDLLVPLGTRAKVLVGTRPGRLDRQTTLVDLLGPQGTVADLAAEPATEEDIRSYVSRRLGDVPEAGAVAAEVTRRAVRDGGGFLYARVVTSQLAAEPVDATVDGWQHRLAASVTSAFAGDLDRSGQPGARHLLTALAWSYGKGLPARDVLPALASAVAGGPGAGGSDVEDALHAFGRYVVESGEDGHAVYRLFHQELVDHLAGDPEEGRRVDLAVGALLVAQSAGGTRPADVAPYLRRHAASHLARAGTDGIAVLRRLAETNPDAYRPGLTAALTYRFASLGSEMAESHAALEDAIAGAWESTTLARHRANTGQAPDLSDLAMEVTRLGTLLGTAGRHEEAIGLVEEAVELYRGPVDHEPNLALALRQLGDCLTALGRPLEAQVALQEAVAVNRGLAAAHPGEHLTSLAFVLVDLSRSHASLGRHDEALASAQEAVATLRHLSARDPGTGLEPLAGALDNLSNQLAASGHDDGALAALQEAVTIHRGLAAADPRRLTGLANALVNLSGRLGGPAHRTEAVAASREAVAIRRQLADPANPETVRFLAMVLHSHSVRLSFDGDHHDACAASREAVAIIRLFAEADPDSHLFLLALMANQLGQCLRELGRTDELLALRADLVDGPFLPADRAYLLLHCVGGLSDRPLADRFDDLATALDLLSPGPMSRPDRVAQVHAAMRDLRAQDQAAFDDSWRRRFGDLPLWLTYEHGLLPAVREWFAAPGWTASRDYLAQHPELLTDEADALLADLLLDQPDAMGIWARRLAARLVTRCGCTVREAYAPLIAMEDTAGPLEDAPLYVATVAALAHNRVNDADAAPLPVTDGHAATWVDRLTTLAGAHPERAEALIALRDTVAEPGGRWREA